MTTNNYGISDDELNEQGIFNKAARHLLTQMTKCRDDEGCALRNDSGQACAVGALLTDAEVFGSEANETSDQTCKRLPKFKPFAGLLRDLQSAHDCHDPLKWKDELTRIAERRGLTMPEVTS